MPEKRSRHSTSFDEDTFALLQMWKAELRVYDNKRVIRKMDELVFGEKHLTLKEKMSKI